MAMRLNLIILLLFLLVLPSSAKNGDVLFNGTHMYLVTGESVTLYQGYVLSLKSVSNDGSMWFQLIDNDRIAKNEIVYSYGSLEYNSTNMTIISLKVEKVYSGPSEQNLVSFYLYQFNDPEKPFPDKTIIPENTVSPGNNNTPPKKRPQIEPLAGIAGFVIVLLLVYFVRKLW